MAMVNQSPFLVQGLNTIEADGSRRLPYFASSHSKDAMHVDNSWNWASFQAVESTQASNSDRIAWNNLGSVSTDELRKACIHGKLGQVLQQMSHLAQEGVYIPEDSLLQLIQRCIDEHDLASGRKAQQIIKTCGLSSDAFLGSHLIRMFGIVGCLAEAMESFTNISQPTVFAWSAIISAHVGLGYYEQAIYIYTKMQGSGVEPDGHLFVSVLKACMGIGNLEQSLRIHLDIVSCGFDNEVFIGSTLIDMYAKYGNLDRACQIFNKLPDRNVVTWSVLIDGHTQHGHSDKALALFEQMRVWGMEPNPVTCASVLKACFCIETGRQVHSYIVGHGLESNTNVGCMLVNMYSKSSSFMDAHIVFERLHKRDILAWNALITVLCQNGYEKDALDLFKQMQQEGIQPNLSIYSSILKACVNIGAFQQGFLIHALMVESNILLDVYTGSGLIDLYSKYGDLRSAEAVFESLPEQNVVTWSVLITGFLHCGYSKEVFHYFQQMKKEGVAPDGYTLVSVLKACSDLSSFEHGRHIHATLVEEGFDFDTCVSNALMDMYIGCDLLQEAYIVFNKLPHRDVISWSTLMAGNADYEDGEVVLQHYMAMLHEGIKPNVVTFISLLRACSSVAALEHGRYFHAQIVLSGFDLDVYISSALIDMYSSCGCFEEAHIVFHRVKQYDAGVWSAMITCYGQNSNYQEALLYFESMQRSGVKLDSVAFLCILSACNRAGLVLEAQLHLMAMRDTHGLHPSLEHLNCMADLLGNANLLHEARDLLETMPFGSNIVGWVSLLSSCKRHHNVEIGREFFDYIVTVDKRNVTSYVLMSNIYFSCGMQKYGEAINELRVIANGWKKPGKAFIEVNKKIHSFMVGEKNHPESEAMYNELKRLNEQMKMEEPQVLVGSDLEGLPAEMEEDRLCGHCEKLALSFGLLHTPRGTTIRISKNLRMCAVCHKDTKFISKAEKREIIIVDACLVHHFRDGLCHCNMYTT
ncbi:hypothetical protein L7F22_047534 [Adiantum nelumboides]|nr:hypothetical protein [Adiantum nelumboides]